jgi:hypothetical protein
VSYRVYRSESPGQTADQLRLLADVPGAMASSFVDSGAPTGSGRPLVLGALGRWHPIQSLNTARMAHAVTARSVGTVAGLYALAGSPDGSSPLFSTEYLLVNADGTVPPASYWAMGPLLTTPRFEVGAWAATGAFVSDAESSRAIHVGPGRTFSGGFARDVTAVAVLDTGALGAITEVETVTTNRAGYIGGVGLGSLFLFGGQSGLPSTTGVSAMTCTSSTCPSNPSFPHLGNYSSQGARLLEPRYLAGYAQFGPFVYVVGGTTNVSLASASVERTPY